jgi:hypothetical protein
MGPLEVQPRLTGGGAMRLHRAFSASPESPTFPGPRLARRLAF